MKANATWAVAECFRFLDSFLYARQEIEKLGKILGFRVKSFGNVKLDDLKYFGESYRPDLVRFGSLRVRNGIAKRPRIPRRLHPRRRRAHRCWHTVPLGRGDKTHRRICLHNSTAATLATRRYYQFNLDHQIRNIRNLFDPLWHYVLGKRVHSGL